LRDQAKAEKASTSGPVETPAEETTVKAEKKSKKRKAEEPVEPIGAPEVAVEEKTEEGSSTKKQKKEKKEKKNKNEKKATEIEVDTVTEAPQTEEPPATSEPVKEDKPKKEKKSKKAKSAAAQAKVPVEDALMTDTTETQEAIEVTEPEKDTALNEQAQKGSFLNDRLLLPYHLI
jgi:hypothetical protein